MMQRVLIINCFETYEHRADLLYHHFLQKGSQVKVITSDWLHMHKSVRQNCPEGYEMLNVKPYRKNLSPQRLMSHHGFAQAALKKMEAYQPDLVWVFIPPNSLVKAAAQYKKTHPHVKLVMDLIDMWPETMPISQFKDLPPFTNWRDLRDHYLQYADAVVTECNLFQTILGGKCEPKRMHTLYLARETQAAVSEIRLSEDRIALCYLGSINNIIDIPCIAQIIRGFNSPVDLHIIGDGENRQKLIDEASAAGANVVYHGKIYECVEKQKIFDKCHFGLNIMKDSVFVGLTMKSMDYWEASLPIINNIKGDTWEIVEANRIGLNYTPGERYSAEQIDLVQKNRTKVRTVFEEKFTKEAFSKALNGILDSLKDENKS